MNLQTNLDNGMQLDDLDAMKPLEAAIQAQKEYLFLNQEMKIAVARRSYTRDRLIAELEARGSDRDGNEDGKVLLMHKTYPKVTDHEALKEYIYSLDEPVGTYLKEVFIKGNKSQGIDNPLDILVEKAMLRSIEEDIDISEAMPPGLTVTTDASVRVTLKKNTGETAPFKDTSKYPELDAALEEK